MSLNTQEPASKVVKSDILRWILICCGWSFIFTGVIGLFLPLLPTVPFLLLAAACFARSSERFHSWLLQHTHLGPLIRDYLNGGGIPIKARNTAIIMIWISLPASAFLLVSIVWVKIALLAVAAGITLYLLGLPIVPPAEINRKADKDVV
jgi:hypothetical protein